MNELQIFKKKELGQVRVIEKNKEAWFCLTDVCKVLEITNTSQLKSRLNPDGVIINEVIDSMGRKQEATFVNEPNLYKSIFQSRKKEADKFTNWVTNEILPTIRRHGVYLTDSKIEEALTDPDTIIKLAISLKKEREERKKLQLKDKQNIQIIGELKPKADYTDLILKSKNTMTVTAIAKDYGMSAIEFNKTLHDLKIQYKQSEQWFLYEKYQRCGYTHSKTTNYQRNDGTIGSKLNTEWTQKRKIIFIQ